MKTKNCINCKHFAWWDRDYCCIEKMEILQSSYKGEFTDDILISLEKNKDCKKWKKGNKKIVEMHEEIYNEFLKSKNLA